MTDKELRRMSRGELLELLVFQMEENEKLRKQLKETQEELRNRQIMIAEAGSIAEAALKLNGVFEAAEEAAKQYVENIKRLTLQEKQGTVMAAGQVSGKNISEDPIKELEIINLDTEDL